MNSMLWSLALSCLLAPPVEKSDDATTHLYVRTSPAGAEIVLDGKSIGKSPGVFPVESGARRLVIELDGHVAEDQKITIRDGRVTRIELTLKPRPEASAEEDAAFRRMKIGKKVSDFPEPIDLSTPESAWAAYHRASGSQDAQGMLDLSLWARGPQRVEVKQRIEKSWTKGDPNDMAAYNKAQLDAELIEIVVYRDKLAATISRLEFPPDVGRHPFSQRTFGLIDGKWKNLGENRCPSLEAAVSAFTEGAERHWRSHKAAVIEEEGDRALQRYRAAVAGQSEDPLAAELPPNEITQRKVGKKVADFPEAVDLSTPESAWAAYHRASGGQDAQGVVDLSWVKIDPREMERFWTTGNPNDMAAYNKAQLDAELLDVVGYGEKLAATISRLEFPPGVGRRPFSQRTFGLIDGEWKNLGEDRCESLDAAAENFIQKREALWRQYQKIAKELPKDAPATGASLHFGTGPARRAFLTGVANVNGVPEAWFTTRPDGETLKLRVGDKLIQYGDQIRKSDGPEEPGLSTEIGRVAEIKDSGLVLERNGERWRLTIGETLAQAHALPSEL